MSMEAQAWTAIGLLAATLIGSLFYLGNRIDSLGARIDSRIDGLETRLDGRIDGLENRLESRIDSLSARLDSFAARIDALESSLSARMDAIAARIDALSTRLGRSFEAPRGLVDHIDQSDAARVADVVFVSRVVHSCTDLPDARIWERELRAVAPGWIRGDGRP